VIKGLSFHGQSQLTHCLRVPEAGSMPLYIEKTPVQQMVQKASNM